MGWESIPILSVAVSVILSLLSVIILLIFIHRIVRMVQPYNIIANVAGDLRETSTRFFSVDTRNDINMREELASPEDIPASFEKTAYHVTASSPGYVEKINYREIALYAEKNDLLIRMERRPGEFVVPDDILASIWHSSYSDEHHAGKLRKLLVLGTERTVEMDIEFTIEQLLEVSARALTSEINDLFTATTCLDWLKDAFIYMLKKKERFSIYAYRERKLRLIIKPFKLSELMSYALQVCWNSAISNTALSAIMAIHILSIIGHLAVYTGEVEEQQVLKLHADAINDRCMSEKSLDEYERHRIREQYQKTIKAISR